MAHEDSDSESTDQKPKDIETEKEKSLAEGPSPEEHKHVAETNSNKLTDKLKRLWQKYLKNKKLTIPLSVLVFLLVLLGIPFTRYPILGLFVRSDFYVTVLDDATGKTVSGATISLSGKTEVTTTSGQVKFHSKVGKHKLTAQKKYYQDYTSKVTVPLKQGTQAFVASMMPTGRQVPITITNKITGKGIEKITVTALDTEAATDKDGVATIVLPPDKDKLEATISGEGYSQVKVTIKVTEDKVDENSFKLVPSGKIYFLSKLSGKIDVVKTDLDGSNRQTVLAGTGKESETDTILLASRDWQYLVLKSKREGNNPKIYVIHTSDDKLVTADEGDADFTLYGWVGHYVVYIVNRNVNDQAQKYRLKSFNAESGKLTLLDASDYKTQSGSYPAEEQFWTVSLVDNDVYYTKQWNNYYGFAGLDNQAVTIKPDGSGKKILGKIAAEKGGNYTTIFLNKPHEFYASGYDNIKNEYRYFEWKIGDGSVKEITKDAEDVEKFNTVYPTYVVSPSGNETFWSEQRDGKPVFFVGNKDAENSKTIGTYDEADTYGWYGDNYLLISKKGSELYILSRDGGQPFKVTDYHKPSYNYRGYGGGYGGN